jgi:hypothetical protein
MCGCEANRRIAARPADNSSVKNQPTLKTESPHEEIERLRLTLTVREVLFHARYDAEKSEIASLRRRLSERDKQLRALEAAVREKTRYLSVSVILLGLMVIASWF